MNKPSCHSCLNLRQTIRITSPEELRKALIMAAREVRLGNLNEITADYLQVPPEGVLDKHRISYIQPPPQRLSQMVERKFPFGWRVGNWSDLLELYFQCPKCRTVFVLHAETYHGCGGAWEYVESSEKLFQAA